MCQIVGTPDIATVYLEQSFSQCFITISSSQLILLGFEQIFHSACNITDGTLQRVYGREGGKEGVKSQRWAISSVMIIWTRYESKKCQARAQTCLDGLRDASLPLESISDPCLPCSALHGSYYLRRDFMWLVKLTRVKQTSQSSLVMTLCMGSV